MKKTQILLFAATILSVLTGFGQNPPSDTTTAEYRIISAVQHGDLAAFVNLVKSNPLLINALEPGRGETLLQVAVRNDHPAMAKLLLEKGLDVNARNRVGNTALHLSGFTGTYSLVEILMKAGADYTIRNTRGRTAIEYVPFGKNPEIYRLFLEKDKDILLYKSVDGATLLHWSANAGDTAGFTYLLGKGLVMLAEDNNGSNPVHWAYSGGDKVMLGYLKDKRLDYNNVSSQGYSPITVAIMYKSQSTLDFLLENGMDINQKFPPDNNTLFIEACDQNALDIARTLAERGAEIDAADNQGFTALCWSVLNHNQEFAAYLLQKGADVNHKVSGGRTPLLMAVGRDSLPMVKLLCGNGADVKTVDSLGFSALHTAAINGNAEIAGFLLSKGAPADNKDHFGLTPLHYAAIYGRSAIGKLLIKNGADPDTRDKQQHNPFYYSSLYGNDCMNRLLQPSGLKKSESSINRNFLASNLKNGESFIHYLNHSGYAIETAEHFLVFDYFHYLSPSDEPSLQNGRINPADLKGKKIIVFVSHEHSDHYDMTIWKWKTINPDIAYVMGFQPEVPCNYEYLEPRKSKNIDGVQIFAIKSTDKGVGFLVEADGIVVYHPGDHVNKSRVVAEDFKEEIDYLAGLEKKIDIALFPVAGCGFPDLAAVKAGNLYSIEKLRPEVCISMHAGIEECKAFSDEINEKYPGKKAYFGSYPGDTFHYARK